VTAALLGRRRTRARHGETSVTLPGVPRSVAAARRVVREALGDDCPATPDAVLCAAELVTNAILYTRSGQDGGQFTLTLAAVRGGIEIRVHDQGPCSSAARSRPVDEHGRGWTIIAALSTERGIGLSGSGQVAWCRIAVSQHGRRS
jgi:anti-sigma regulatory factor (Ser/Thr protein kinase)